MDTKGSWFFSSRRRHTRYWRDWSSDVCSSDLMLATGGTCVSFGITAGAESTFDVRSFYFTGGATLYGFILFHEVLARPASEGLARLVRLVADGTLPPRIEVEAARQSVVKGKSVDFGG